MTDDAKAVDIAKRWLTNSVDENFRYFDFNDAAVLAKAFLALSEKCRKQELVVNYAKNLCHDLYKRNDGSSFPPTTTEKFLRLTPQDPIVYALAALEPGEADG